jgi:hypothetical protein
MRGSWRIIAVSVVWASVLTRAHWDRPRSVGANTTNFNRLQFFVSSSQGDDSSADGTAEKPFKTIQACVDWADAYDQCTLFSGRYSDPVLIMASASQILSDRLPHTAQVKIDSKKPITIAGETGATAVIDGSQKLSHLAWTREGGGASPRCGWDLRTCIEQS